MTLPLADFDSTIDPRINCYIATVRMRCDCCYDGKFLNISQRFLADGSDLRIFLPHFRIDQRVRSVGVARRRG
jgi:hypothetical protein